MNNSRKLISFSMKTRLLTRAAACFAEEKMRSSRNCMRFMSYLFEHMTADQILLKTVDEISLELDLTYNETRKILVSLEREGVIYRRRGIIGIRDELLK